MMERLRRAGRASFEREVAWLRKVAWGILTLLLLVGFGSELESSFAPVLRDVRMSPGAMTPDGRMCFMLGFHKVRAQLPLAVWGELYGDEARFPVFVGVEHDDGSPYGPQYARTAGIGVASSCVHVPEAMRSARRLGLRIHFTYRSWHGLWPLSQDPIWVDWYSGR